jgi:hypothetical protein
MTATPLPTNSVTVISFGVYEINFSLTNQFDTLGSISIRYRIFIKTCEGDFLWRNSENVLIRLAAAPLFFMELTGQVECRIKGFYKCLV